MNTFSAQGGYAFYVWSAYGMALILLVLELVQLGRRRRTILAHLVSLLRTRAQWGHGRPETCRGSNGEGQI